ncbi:MAG: tetratricopeptide repeat-containing sulfotransferase family protein, partial [Asticcacaulis sp.]
FVPRLHLVAEICKTLDRRKAAAVIAEDLRNGPQTGTMWKPVAQLAGQLGEQTLSIEAARRFAMTPPLDASRMTYYATVLSRFGRLNEALAAVDLLPAAARNHPGLLHFRGVTATQMGDFTDAEALLRQAIAISPAPIQWLALSVAKKFKPGDPDIAAMEAVLPRVGRAPPEIKAQLMYALGKAYDDIGQIDLAAQAYTAGAVQMRIANGANTLGKWDEFSTEIVRGYSPETIARLKPSGADASRMLFVTGYPRSGTTLVEQILTSHSKVTQGAEMNVISMALMPAGNPHFGMPMNDAPTDDVALSYPFYGDFTIEHALNYQDRSDSTDPWGDIGRDYLKMAEERFGAEGIAVDKTVIIGQFVGLLLHSLPKAKIFWLRRRPEDCALSIFRLYSLPGTVPWTYSPQDIATFFKAEDRLYEHWARLFPDRIMTVPYEELVTDPQTWIRRILAHAGLPEEPQVFEPHKSKRAVSTASMAQVRAPISTARIGAAEAYKDFTEQFRRAYYG